MLMDGALLRDLQDALISAFPNRAALKQMVALGINEKLDSITGENNLREAVFELLEWAQARNKVEKLVKAALAENPYNPELINVAGRLGISVEPTSSSSARTIGIPHWLKFLFTTRLGWVIIGSSFLLTGLVLGISSPWVPYMKSEDVANAYDYVSENSNIYIYPAGNHLTAFIVRCSGFTPYIDCANFHGDRKIAFLACHDTISVNDKNLEPKPFQAHVIEQLILSNGFGSSTTYTASDYNSDGAYDNRWWPWGDALIGFGLLIACVALVVRKRSASARGSAS